jgi:hypothetical protein
VEKDLENLPPIPPMKIVKTFAKYIWPVGDMGTKARVVVALGLLIGSKVSVWEEFIYHLSLFF